MLLRLIIIALGYDRLLLSYDTMTHHSSLKPMKLDMEVCKTYLNIKKLHKSICGV